MKDSLIVVLVFIFTTSITTCGATTLSPISSKQGDTWWGVVRGGRDGGVKVPLHHHHHFNITLHSNSSFRPLITISSFILDLGKLTANTTLTLRFTCPSNLTCTVQVGETVTTLHLAQPFILQAEERGQGKYLLVYHRPPELTYPDKIMHYKSRSGSTAALVTVVGVMASIVVVVVLSSWRLSPPKRHPPEVFALPYLQEPLLPATNTATDLPSVIEEESSSLLWEAVVAGDVAGVECLLEHGHDPRDIEPRRTTSPLLDAHILGQTHVLHTFLSYLGSVQDDHEHVMEQVVQEWNKMSRHVFVAAECGMYNHEGGVDTLLNKYKLPGTLRDECGRSLVHYMALPTTLDGCPPWDAKDMVAFLTNHEHFINSVDFCGCTALHHLARHAHNNNDRIIWGGREWGPEEAWVSVAQLLIQYGCDPRLVDNTGNTAHDLADSAANYDLAHFLQQQCEELGVPDLESAPAILGRAARAARRGDTSLLKQLLDGFSCLSAAQPTPAVALAPVLVEGVLGSHRGVVMMLLCAGASPLCGAGPGRLTPLYAAHHTTGLPVVIPALLRQACHHQLLEEASSLGIPGALRHALQGLAHRVLAEGVRAKWVFTNNESEARMEEAQNLFRRAASAGLILACRVLGQQNLCLHALPPIHTPVAGAHPSAQAVLVHELDMTPLGEGLDGRGQPGDSRRRRELAMIEAVLECEADISSRTAARKIIDLLRNEDTACQAPTPKIMVTAAGMVAQLGLATALHKMVTHWATLDLTVPVSPLWGGKVIHVGVLWGHVCIVELLTYLGIGLQDITSGGMSAAHVAALIGHTALLTFLKQHQQRVGFTTQDVCSAGLTPHQLLTGVREWTARRAQLTHTEAVNILLLPRGASRAAEVMKLRSTRLGMSTMKDLLRVSHAWMKPVPAMTFAEIESRHLCHAIAAAGLPGELLPAGLVLGAGDHLVLLYVMQRHDLRSWKPQTLRQTFTNKLRAALEQQVVASSELCAIPFVLTNTEQGFTLAWLTVTNDELQLLRLTLVPVVTIKPGPMLAHSLASTGVKQDINMYAVPMSEGWTCWPSVAMSAVITSLESRWKQTWVVCHFLNSLLEPRWWSPAHVSHHTGVSVLPEIALASAFLQQLAEDDEQWTDAQSIGVLQRVVAIFSRAARGNFGCVWESLYDMQPEFPPEIRASLPVEAAEGMLLYLKELLHTTQELEMAPRVTFKE